MFAHAPDEWSIAHNHGVSGETCLIVPVPVAEAAVGGHRGRLDPSAADGAPAHITVLSPFLRIDAVRAEEQARLRALFAIADPIPFSLTRVARFPGVLFLAPEPSERFVALTEAVWRRWPERPPYEGAYDQVIPHLTVGVGQADFADVERALTPLLPIAATAEEVWLLVRSEAGRWELELAFPLGA
jgi:2'-5' RNA ligase superfamily protein